MDTNVYNGIKCNRVIMDKVHCSSAECDKIFLMYWQREGSQGKGLNVSVI